MKQLRISPSTLSQYCAFVHAKNEGTEWEVTAERLAAYLKGEKLVSSALTKGYAFHKLLEHGTADFIQADGSLSVYSASKNATIFFDDYTRRLVNRFRELHPLMLHEVPCQLNMSVKGYAVTSFMRIDAVNPLPSAIHDFKTSSSYRMPTAETYYDSVQWRMYLMACQDVEDFVYNVFRFNDKPQYSETGKSVDYAEFRFWRESDMETIVGEYMSGLIRFCENHNLLDCITIKNDN